jgi:tRNA U34 5-methylaminomethyl-2-thiouridine-forming methyltransferase MnmC
LSADNNDIHLIETSDGSHSLFVRSLNETYHSRHGAVQESQWVFIKHGLDHAYRNREPRIQEVGFGTGLNALLAMRWAEEHRVHVHFTSLETNVLSLELAEQLNYASSEQERSVFLNMHAAPWNEDVSITPHFTLHKAQREVQSEVSVSQFDVIFFDAFGPPTQPEMWTPDIFLRMFNALKPCGILVTYCAKGQVRRDMQSVGFRVERLPGPPGKREMLRATKPEHHGEY